MIPIVEDYLSELVERKLNFLKANPQHYSKVLGTTEAKINRLKQFLEQKPVRVIKGYPRDPAQLPCVCILLSGEEETQEGLGDFDDGVYEDTFENVQMNNEECEVEAVGNLLFVEVSRKPTTRITGIAIKHPDDSFSYMVEDEDYFLDPTLPHQAEIVHPSIGKGDKVYVSYVFQSVTTQEYMSTMFEANYRLECWASNGDLAVELYHLVKWAILSGRDYLGDEKQLFRQRTSGADFQPAPNFFPEFVYRRALSYWCQFSISAYLDDISEEAYYVENVVTNLEVYENGGND